MNEKTVYVGWQLQIIAIDAVIVAITSFIPMIAHSIGRKVLIFEPM